MKGIGMEWLVYGLLFAGLLVEAVVDMRRQKIWIAAAVAEIPLLMGLNYWLGCGGIRLWAASLGVGGVFYGISVVTREQLGKGDAFLFAMTGAGVGLADMMLVLYLTFFLAFLAAAYLWLVKRVGRNHRMPLAPFVLAAYCLVIAQKAATYFIQ
jgi:prepilin signal peptidase PulO-like enzyme (type II secretory pathway)